MSLELGFGITLISRIPDSLSCIPNSKARDSGFHEQKSSGFHEQKSSGFPWRTERIKKKYSELNIRCIDRGVCLLWGLLNSLHVLYELMPLFQPIETNGHISGELL